MSNQKNHNTIYFLTTLSVYLGLVIVGASPHIIAQAEVAQNSQLQRFEFNSETNSILADLENRSHFDHQDILPFVLFGTFETAPSVRTSESFDRIISLPVREDFSENDQVFVISNLPRASI